MQGFFPAFRDTTHYHPVLRDSKPTMTVLDRSRPRPPLFSRGGAAPTFTFGEQALRQE